MNINICKAGRFEVGFNLIVLLGEFVSVFQFDIVEGDFDKELYMGIKS